MISKSELRELLKEINNASWNEINWTRKPDQTPQIIECLIRTWHEKGRMEIISIGLWTIDGRV